MANPNHSASLLIGYGKASSAIDGTMKQRQRMRRYNRAVAMCYVSCFLLNNPTLAFSPSPSSAFPRQYTHSIHTRCSHAHTGGDSDGAGENIISKTIGRIGLLRKRDEEHRHRRDKWLSWMHSGKRRDVEAVKMRDAVELGGLPRSDRYSSRDWFHNTVTLPSSSILRDVLNPILAMSTWATIISVVHRILLRRNPALAGHLCIPSSPHSLMVSALGLLLVFRTNSAYQRFAEGRAIWERILNTSRDLSRMCKLYEMEIGKDKRRRVQRLLAAFPYLLRHRIRPSTVGVMKRVGDPEFERDPEHSLLLYKDHVVVENDAEAARVASDEETTGKSRRQPRVLYWVDRRTLPWRLLPSEAMEACTRAQNRPLWICDRMAKELRTVPDRGTEFTNRERMHLIGLCDQLSRTIGSCERIHQTVVPLNYARHALRSLTLWLCALPFALVKDLGLMTGPVQFVVSWMLFGVYEIGTRIEDPFQGTLRLSILCDQIRRDVLSDELLRDTAFTLDKPKKMGEEEVAQLAKDGDEDEDEEGVDMEDEGKEGAPNGAASTEEVNGESLLASGGSNRTDDKSGAVGP